MREREREPARVRGAADALMMLIIHTADVRLAAEGLPRGKTPEQATVLLLLKAFVCSAREAALRRCVGGFGRTDRGSCRCATNIN